MDDHSRFSSFWERPTCGHARRGPTPYRRPIEAELDPAFLSAIGHPVRFQALVLLERTPSSARELAEVAGLSPGAALHHVRRLRQAGLIEEASPRDRRAFDDRVWRTRRTGWAELGELLQRAANEARIAP